jgi:hypothetical protein
MGTFINAIKLCIQLLFNKTFYKGVERFKQGEYYELSQILSLLQREGRFIDFLMEDISSYQDAQIGAVARTIHQGCQKVLKEYIAIEPVKGEKEGSQVTVEEGFDASAIRLVGNVKGNPPFKGTLAHHGWKVASAKIPPLPGGHDPSIIAPAEVEM